MPATTPDGFPYPTSESAANVPVDLKALADKIQSKYGAISLSNLTVPGGEDDDAKIAVVEGGIVKFKAVSGDATISKTGDLQLGPKVVGNSELGDKAVTPAKLDDGAVTPDKTAKASREALGLSSTGEVRRGKSIIATEESTESTSFTTLTTPDRVQNIVLPTDGLIFIAYQAMWRESVNTAARAAIFIGANQLRYANEGPTDPIVNETGCGGKADAYSPLASSASFGLRGSGGANNAYNGDVTTGQAVGFNGVGGVTGDTGTGGGPVAIFASAGTYDISIRFKASSGAVFAKNRKLWVWVMAF